MLRTAIGKYPHTARAEGWRSRIRPRGLGFRRHPDDQPGLRSDGARAALRRERDRDRDLSSGEGLRQTAGAPARGAGRALPAIRPAVPGGQRHSRPRRSRRAAGSAFGPTAKRPAYGCAASWPTSTAYGPKRCAGSPSRMRMSPSTATRPGPSGRRPARICWPCFARASWTRSSSATTCRTTRRSGRCFPILRPPPRRSGASTASCRSIIWWRSGASWRRAGRI